MERIQKIIASSENISRRKAEELIQQGKIKVNNQTAKLGDKASQKDKITIEGKPINLNEKKEYFILNKPKGILVTKNDPKKRKTIYNLPSLKNLQHLNYTGRLDAMSEGLLILTNDGNLIQKITHPSHHISKTYQVKTSPPITKEHITKLKQGIPIEKRKFYAQIKNQKQNEFEISIQEGRNRIIRKSLESLGYKILRLKRISIANIKLENLKPGEIEKIPEDKIKQLIL